MPKLYFYDTGLACWLLGIREPHQLRSHPLRGAIFETWVVSEMIKHQANQGKTGGLSFYRDSNGAEVDLVIDRPDEITLLEAKSTLTAAPTLFNRIKRVQRHLEEVNRPCNAAVIYGGSQLQRHTNGKLIPWRMLGEEVSF